MTGILLTTEETAPAASVTEDITGTLLAREDMTGTLLNTDDITPAASVTDETTGTLLTTEEMIPPASVTEDTSGAGPEIEDTAGTAPTTEDRAGMLVMTLVIARGDSTIVVTPPPNSELMNSVPSEPTVETIDTIEEIGEVGTAAAGGLTIDATFDMAAAGEFTIVEMTTAGSLMADMTAGTADEVAMPKMPLMKDVAAGMTTAGEVMTGGKPTTEVTTTADELTAEVAAETAATGELTTEVAAEMTAAGELATEVTPEMTAAGELAIEETTAVGELAREVTTATDELTTEVTAEIAAAGEFATEVTTDATLTEEVTAATGGLKKELTPARNPPALEDVTGARAVVVTSDEVATLAGCVEVEVVLTLVDVAVVRILGTVTPKI